MTLEQRISTLAFVCICTNVFSQTPQSFNYQAVVRDDAGLTIAGQSIGYRFTIHQGSPTGTTVYMEEHTVISDDRGLVDLVIGEGTSSDQFNSIDWVSGPYFLAVAIDQTGGSNYMDIGTNELRSVPYAMHAYTADMVDDADADPANELQQLELNGSTLGLSLGNTVEVDVDPENELQTLSLSGNTLSISDGNSVTLPTGNGPDDDSVAKAWVNFPITGTPDLSFDGYNVTATAVVNTGVRTVTLAAGLFSPASNPAMVCQIRNDLAPGFCTITSSTSPSQVTVRTFNAAGQLTDKEFSLIIFGK